MAKSYKYVRGPRFGERVTLRDDEDGPVDAVAEYDARDAAIQLRRSGLDEMADAVEKLILERDGAKSENDRFVQHDRQATDSYRRLEERSRLVDRLLNANGDFVVFSKSRQALVSIDDLRAMSEGREPGRVEQQRVEQPRSLLGGASFDGGEA